MSLAQELRGINFAYTDTAEYIVGRTELPKNRLAVHRSVETQNSAIFAGHSYLEMQDFIITEALKGVTRETPAIDDLLRDNHIPVLRILCHEAESCLPYVKVLNESNHHAHKLVKVYKILSDKEYVSDNSTESQAAAPPKISILDARRGHLHEHVFKGELTAGAIEAFIDQYFSKRHHAHHYSEHPDDYLHKVAKSITGHNYNREIVKTVKGVVLLVHNGSEDELRLADSFERVAEWFHLKKIGKYLKFRILNQKKNLTPVRFHERPVILMIRPHTQHDLSALEAHEVKGSRITKKGLYHLLKTHGRYHLGELAEHGESLENGSFDVETELQQDL